MKEGELLELLAHWDYLRILHTVRRRPMRFGEIQKELALNPVQVDRALKFLRQGLWVIPRVPPTPKGKLLVEYEIGKRGIAILDSLGDFLKSAMRRKARLGTSVVAELESIAR